MENVKEKIPLFKRFIMCIKDLDKYYKLIEEKFSRAILYFITLEIIFAVIISTIITYKANSIIEQVSKYAKDKLPDFEIENELKIDGDEKYVLETNGTSNETKIKCIFDSTSESKDSYEDEIRTYDGTIILCLKDSIYAQYGSMQYEKKYSEIRGQLGLDKIDKDAISEYITNNKKQILLNIFGMLAIAMLIVVLTGDILVIISLTIMVILICKIFKLNLSYGQCVNIVISTFTLPHFLRTLYTIALLLTGFTMEYFQVMYMIIEYIYIIAVLLIMRSDMIKKKQLIKATIQIQNLEKQQINENEVPEDNGEEKEKQKEKKDKEPENKPEPQANIKEGGKQ